MSKAPDSRLKWQEASQLMLIYAYTRDTKHTKPMSTSYMRHLRGQLRSGDHRLFTVHRFHFHFRAAIRGMPSGYRRAASSLVCPLPYTPIPTGHARRLLPRRTSTCLCFLFSALPGHVLVGHQWLRNEDRHLHWLSHLAISRLESFIVQPLCPVSGLEQQLR